MRLISRFVILVSFFVLYGCCHHYVIHDPDTVKFRKECGTSSLTDSLDKNKITLGLPYKLIKEMFSEFPNAGELTAVEAPGSNKSIADTEGLGRVYTDPNHGIFMQEFETTNGSLCIWYKRPGFQQMHVMVNDTLYLFYNNVVYHSIIDTVFSEIKMGIRDTLKNVPVKVNIFAEIRPGTTNGKETTFWYVIQAAQDGNIIILDRKRNFMDNPIVWMKLNKNDVKSFRWK